MSGLSHTVKISVIEDTDARATIYTGTITYPMSVVKHFKAAVPTDKSVPGLVLEENGSIQHNGATSADVLNHISCMHVN